MRGVGGELLSPWPGYRLYPPPRFPLSQLTIHANVTGLTECGCTRRRPKDGSARASSNPRSGGQVDRGMRVVALCLNLRLSRPRRRVLHLLFSKERPNVWPPTIVIISSLPPSDPVLRECGLLGYHCRVAWWLVLLRCRKLFRPIARPKGQRRKPRRTRSHPRV